jgi:hypothetical protein
MRNRRRQRKGLGCLKSVGVNGAVVTFTPLSVNLASDAGLDETLQLLSLNVLPKEKASTLCERQQGRRLRALQHRHRGGC